ncbi:MAG: hypothetical protein AAGF75_08295 [Cyanobacteria bacterium P01_H01_bin.130]
MTQLLTQMLAQILVQGPTQKSGMGQLSRAIPRVRTLGAIAVVGTGTVLMASPALAHGAHVTYQVIQTSSGPTVRVLAAYDTDEPMAAAQVSIYHPETPQTPWMTGITDPGGQFEFSPDSSNKGVGEWAIKVRQAGHGALVTLPWPPASELAAAVEDGSLLADRSFVSPEQGRSLPPWLGLGLGVTGCLGSGWFLMRRSPHPSSGADRPTA